MAAAASKSSMRTESPSISGRPVATAMKGTLASRSASIATLESDNGGGRMMPPMPSRIRRSIAARSFRAPHFSSTIWQPDLTALLQNAHQQLVQVGGARVVVQKADVHRSGLREIARRHVGRIAQLLDRRLDPLQGLGLNIGIAADDARYGHGRNTSVFRNLMHGHRITAPSGRSFQLLPQRVLNGASV